MGNDLPTYLHQELHEALSDLRETLVMIKQENFNLDAWMTTKEAAKFCGVHEEEIRRWVKCGLPYYDMGKGWKFLPRDLIKWCDQYRKIQTISSTSVHVSPKISKPLTTR